VGVTVRDLSSSDRAAAAEVLRASKAFTVEEVLVALDVLDDALAGGTAAGYAAFAAERHGSFAGYVCGGSTPLTESTWHVYWICVHPAAHGTGVGQALTEHFEAHVRWRGAQRVIVETSGRPDYARARRFYDSAGYRPVGRIPDYYRKGDDCVLYCKVL